MSGGEEPGETANPPRKRRRVLFIAAIAVLVVVVAGSLAAAVFGGGKGKGATPVASPLNGRMAPTLAGATVTGGHASLASYRGRWVFVNFFASWCVPCEQETPALVHFASTHRGSQDPAILGVVFQDDAEDVRSFAKSHHVTWPLLTYTTMDRADSYGVGGIPVTFLVAPDGRVVTKLVGPGIKRGDLDTALAAAQAKAKVSAQPGASTTVVARS
jgi:cytochrome c biogenesis protein CcmG/thiol:disulfide interchange protein DsbE